MLDVFDLRPGLTKMAVAPGREGLIGGEGVRLFGKDGRRVSREE